MGKAGKYIFLKRLTSILFPFSCTVLVSIISALILSSFIENTETVRYIVFSLSAFILIIGTILVYNSDKPNRYIKPKRLVNNAIGLALIGFLLWRPIAISYLTTTPVLAPLVLIILITLLYEKKFKKIIVNEILKDNLDEDFDFLTNDNEKTAEMLAEQMTSRLKDKYKDKILVKTLNYARNSTNKLTEFAVGFLTNDKQPKILFEIIIGLDMD
jgi:hypothetical protein